VCKFISAGAIIPEVEQRSTYNPRLLMAPEKKLLTSTEYSDTEKSSKGHDIKDSTGNVCTIEKDEEDLSDVLESMSEKERNKLLKLLKKGKET